MAKPKESIEEYAGLEDGHELRMGFFEHLDELRQRLTRAVFALVVGTVIAFLFTDRVFDLLREPFCSTAGQDACKLLILDPTANIFVFLQVALMSGAILSIPMMTYQLLMFILPGLTRKEKRYVMLSIPATTALFIIGVVFAWAILLPPALDFLFNFYKDYFQAEWTADGYIGFVTSLLFWMGVAFQTPLIFFVVSLLGLVTAETLRRQWRFAIVGASIAAALITPTIDPFNMFLVMAPLLTLYALSIVLVYIGRKFSGVDRGT